MAGMVLRFGYSTRYSMNTGHTFAHSLKEILRNTHISCGNRRHSSSSYSENTQYRIELNGTYPIHQLGFSLFFNILSNYFNFLRPELGNQDPTNDW